MNKILTLLAVGILALGSLGVIGSSEIKDENLISDTIYFSQPTLSENENYVSVKLSEATSYSWEENKPSLPVVAKVYTFPLGTCIDIVNVEFTNTIKQEISKPVECSPELFIDSIEHI